MKKRSLWTILLIGAIPLFGMLSTASFGAYQPEQDKIEQDIEILESVLDQLIIQDSPFLFSGNDHVKGLYLNGFGVMFDLESNGLLSLSEMIARSVNAIPRITFMKQKDDEFLIGIDDQKKKSNQTIDKQAEIEKSLQETEDLIFKFYKDYASTVKSLSEKDRICVNIRNTEGFIIGDLDDDIKVPSQLRYCVNVGDLAEYRRGKLSESKLHTAVKIERIYEDEHDRDLEIMERIFDRSLGRDKGSKIFGFDGKTRGMYLDGFGAIFFSPTTVFERFEHVFVRKAGELEKKLAKAEAARHEKEEEIREHEKKLEEYETQLRSREGDRDKQRISSTITVSSDDDSVDDRNDFNFHFDFDFDQQSKLTDQEIDSVMNDISGKIIDVLGQYGQTLRNVKKNEWIMVAVDVDNHLFDKDWNMLYLKIKKADVERYARDEIDAEKFKKTVEIWRD